MQNKTKKILDKSSDDLKNLETLKSSEDQEELEELEELEEPEELANLKDLKDLENLEKLEDLEEDPEDLNSQPQGHSQYPMIKKDQFPILYPASNKALPPAQSLDAYIRSVHEIPMLTAEEEYSLAMKLKHHGDIEAAQRLVMSHLRFVVKVARGFSGYGLPQADLIQEGNIGLMKAVKRYDPDVGVRLVSFAVHWIKSEMHEFVIRNWRLVKIATTKAQRKLFFNLRSKKTRLGWFTPEEINEVAKELNVKPSDVIEMEHRLNAYESSFDAPVDADDEEPNYSPSVYLEHPNANPETQAMEDEIESKTHEKLIEGLRKLDPRAQDILKTRFLDDQKATLHELAAKYNISAERVRQIENQALKTLKNQILIE